MASSKDGVSAAASPAGGAGGTVGAVGAAWASLRDAMRLQFMVLGVAAV